MFIKSHTRFLATLLSCIGIVACADSVDTPAVNAPNTVASPVAGSLDISLKSDPDPPRSGDNSVEVQLANPDGTPLTDASVSTTFYMPAMPSMNMPEMRSEFPMVSQGNGSYRGDGQLVMSGTWDVTVNVTRNGEKLASKKFTVIAK